MCRAAGIAGADFAAVGRAAWFARAAGASARISASTAGVAGNSPRIIAARLAPLVASIVNSGPTGGGLGPLKRRCSAISRARSLPSSGARFGRSLSSEAPRRAASLTCSASSSRSFCSVRRAARLAVMCSIVAALLELLRSSCSARAAPLELLRSNPSISSCMNPCICLCSTSRLSAAVCSSRSLCRWR